MKQDSPQVEKSFTKDDAYQVLTLINTWIGNIDTKISFALALVCVFIGMNFSYDFPKAFQKILEISKLTELNLKDVFAIILVGLLYLSSLTSTICFVLAIMARIKKNNNVVSLFFFGTISKMGLQNYKNEMNQITENKMIEDLEEQIHINSTICTQKAKLYNKGLYFLLVTIVLWFICSIFKLI